MEGGGLRGLLQKVIFQDPKTLLTPKLQM